MANLQHPMLRNAESGQIIELIKSPFTIGRSLISDYVIENKIVSRIHCSLTKTDDGWTLTDSSTNGTLVNDGHYKGETSPILKHNDEISLGYHSYTYKFLTEDEKAPNLQIEKLKSQDITIQDNGSILNELRSPSTPSSFDENGVSDDLLNNLADNMLNRADGEPSNLGESKAQADSLLKDLDGPTTSTAEVTSQPLAHKATATPLEQEVIIVNPPGCDTVTSQMAVLNNLTSDQLSIERNDPGDAISTAQANTGIPETVTSTNKEKNNDMDETAQSSSNSSGNTVIYSLPDEHSSVTTVTYSLPDEISLEAPQSITTNTAKHVLSINVESNKKEEIPEVCSGSVVTSNRIVDASTSSTSFTSTTVTCTAKPRDLLAESIDAVARGYSEDVSSSSKPSASTTTTSTAKPKHKLADSIQAVAQRYSDLIGNIPVQGSSMASSTSYTVSSTSSGVPIPTTISLTSPRNANKKVKVMAVSPGVMSQLRPVAGQVLTAYTVGSGQQAPIVRRLTQYEMQRIMANQPRMPIVVLDKVPIISLPSTVVSNIGTLASSENNGGGVTTVSSSTHVPVSCTLGQNSTVTSSTGICTNTRNRGGSTTVSRSTRTRSTYTSGIDVMKRLIAEGSIQNSNSGYVSHSTRSKMKGAIFDVDRGSGVASTTAADSGVGCSRNAMLRVAQNQNSATDLSRIGSGNILLQTAENQNAATSVSGIISGNTLLQAGDRNAATGVSRIDSSNALLQAAQYQNASTDVSRVVSGNTPVQTGQNANTTESDSGILLGHMLQLNATAEDNIVVPEVVQEVVIDNTVGITGNVEVNTVLSTHQGVPPISTLKHHDSQESGPSKAPEKSEIIKENNQNHYEEMENELMCTICANLFIKAVTLGCSHSFCQYCIGQWKKKKTECPICRNKMTSTIRTLVLDNIIEKMLETASKEDKEERKAAIEERNKIEDEENAKKNLNPNKNRTGSRRGRRGNANIRGNQPGSAAIAVPVITIADSPSTTDSDASDNSSNNDDDDDEYYGDEWYNGRAGAYYGGYGRCYKCGDRGHWANGCPYR